MSEVEGYTPSWELLREGYWHVGGSREAFDRRLRAERARIWDEGYDAGERDVLGHVTFDEPCIPNPYRKGGDL